MMKIPIYLTVIFLSALSALHADADMIKLKSDGTLKGVIKGEDETTVTLLIGSGTMKIRKSEIESMEKSTQKENAALENSFRKKGIERGTYVPPGLEELARKLKDVTTQKKEVEAAKNKLDELKKNIDEKLRRFNSLRTDFDAKNLEVHDTDPKSNVERYNRVITEMNMINVKLSSLSDELNKLSPRVPEYERVYWKALTDYSNEVGDFKLYLDKEIGSANKRGVTEDESLFFDTVKRSVADIEKGINKDSVEARKSEYGLTVKVTLNGEVTCIMAVDTGAALVTISKEIADRLEINPHHSFEDQKFTLADGSVASAKVIYIKSVKVGSSVVYDVPSAVMDNPPGPGIDGLLGMSFLNNFNVKIDSANDRLILETVK